MKIELSGRRMENTGRMLGMQNDNRVETVEFSLPRTYEGKDLSQGVGMLLFCRGDGVKGVVPLDKTLQGDRMILCWQVGRQVTAAPGLLQVQLKICGLEEVLWHSEITGFQIAKSIAEESGQAMMPMAPEHALPITAAERQLIIPEAYRRIAVKNDENSQRIPLRLPRYFDGADLSGCDFFLKTLSSGGRDDVALSPVRVGETEIEFLWTLSPPQTSYEGVLRLQLLISGDGFKWESEAAGVEILPSLDGDPALPGTPSYLDGILQRTQQAAGEAQSWAQAAEQAARRGPIVGEDGYWHLWNAQAGAYEPTQSRAEVEISACTFTLDEETGLLQMEFPQESATRKEGQP